MRREPSLLTQCGSSLTDAHSIATQTATTAITRRASVILTRAFHTTAALNSACLHRMGQTCETEPDMTLLSAVLADSINDVSSTRKVYLLAGALAVLGVLLIIVTVWFWRTTRHDPELLAPLEQMGTKRFRAVDPAT